MFPVKPFTSKEMINGGPQLAGPSSPLAGPGIAPAPAPGKVAPEAVDDRSMAAIAALHIALIFS
jgi:hypothetical protein